MAAPANDLSLYDRHAAHWWATDHRFSASLQAVNRALLPLIRASLGRPVPGLAVADLGCGGGLLAVPLVDDGAWVAGVDLSLASLRAAGRQAAQAGRPAACGPALVQGDIRRPPLTGGWADLVLVCDVLEHVDDWGQVVDAGARLLRPGGILFAATINRTWRARLLVVTLGEGLGFIPRGTHDPALFIPPDDLAARAVAAGLRTQGRTGVGPAWWASIRERSLVFGPGAGTASLYAAWFRRA